MKVSIGILAWNEEASIAQTIQSVFAQSLADHLVATGGNLELVIVPNGCSDQTAAVAAQACQQFASTRPGIVTRVEALTRPGKTNAWNEYVHRLSEPAAEVLILMDADIVLRGTDTLWNMVSVLREQPQAVVATDEPLKHIALKKTKSWVDRISLTISAMTKAAPGQLTGQLYAARATALRQIIIPEGIIVEDGFLKQMLVTDGLSQPADNSRIVRAPHAAHVFEAYTRLVDILPNQRRQAVGHTLYTYLRDYLQCEIKSGRRAEKILRENGAADPEWFLHEIKRRVAEGGPWVMHRGALAVRWKRWRAQQGLRRLTFFPAALVGWILDLVIYSWANRTLKKGQLKGIWKDTKTTHL
jgi:glycosyltransferase involved in cell wall biosynthesis